jgi:hypothetical protein
MRLGSVTKKRSRSGKLRPTALVWGPTTAQCGSVGALNKKIILHIGHRDYLKSTSDEIQLQLYFSVSQLILQSVTERRRGLGQILVFD